MNIETLSDITVIAWLLFMGIFCAYKYTSQNKKYSEK